MNLGGHSISILRKTGGSYVSGRWEDIVNAKQIVSFTGTPTDGTWTLTLGEETTDALAHDADAETVELALMAFTAITSVSVTGDYEDGFTIEFDGADAGKPFDTLEVDVSGLTGVTDGSVVVLQIGSGTISVFNAEANVQPLNGHELLQLPEGDRDREHKKMYTAFQVKDGDIVTLEDGLDYEANNIENWSMHPLPHYKGRITRIEEQD